MKKTKIAQKIAGEILIRLWRNGSKIFSHIVN